MAAGFKVWDLAHSELLQQYPHLGAAAVGVTALVVSGLAYRVLSPKVSVEAAPDEVFVPPSNLGVRNIYDLLAGFVQGLGKDIIGHHYTKFLPLLIFIFTWTLLNNLLGVIPGFGSATDNINTTLGMGAFIFLYYNYQGFKAHGFSYLSHFTGHLHGVLLIAMGWVMFFIETISHLIRPVTLGIRLRTNISVDHFVFHIFSSLIADFSHFLSAKLGAVGTVIGYVFQALGPIPIVLLGILVCVIQAFVFTLLSAIYIGMATAHEDH